MPENHQDIIIMKSDGMPTYHFAHVVDDYLMGTTHVIRGDEWLSSIPIHLQLFDTLAFPRPNYGHIAPIMKKEGESKRKFSKRKDLDATTAYYREEGFPGTAVNEYFMRMIQSDFEEWRMKHPTLPMSDFVIDITTMSVSGALFDRNKLLDISKDFIAILSAEEVYDHALDWARKYDLGFFTLLTKYPEYSKKVLGIGRDSYKPRKDIAKWSDIKPAVAYFYDEWFEDAVRNGHAPFTSDMKMETARKIVLSYKKMYCPNNEKENWFENIKRLAESLGFATDVKTYKKNPGAYAGHIGDVAMLLRMALTAKTNTPELFDIMNVMGEKRVEDRLSLFLDCLQADKVLFAKEDSGNAGISTDILNP